MEYPIPRTFAKSPKVETYNGTTDLDEHVEHLDTILYYRRARGTVKCKLFVLTLKNTITTWFKGLQDNSINSWGELCSEFTSKFTARRKWPKIMAVLTAIVQDKKETLGEYMERFTRSGVEVQGATDGLKCFIFESKA